MKPRELASTLAILGMLCVGSCATFDEVYHFAIPLDSTEGKSERLHHHYRVRIKGWTFLSASQYAAGLYDAKAVDALFGEVEGQRIAVDGIKLAGHEARSAATPATSKALTSAGGATTTEAQAKSCDHCETSDLQGQKLVIFLSTNADFYLRQLKDFIQTSNLQTNVASLLLMGDAERSMEAEQEQIQQAQAAVALAAKYDLASGGTFASGATPSKNVAAQALADLLRATAASSNDSEGSGTIVDAASGRQWLATHPRAFRRSGGAR